MQQRKSVMGKEKCCGILVGGNSSSNNKCSSRIVLQEHPLLLSQEILSEIKEAGNLGQVLIEGDFNCPYIERVSASSG